MFSLFFWSKMCWKTIKKTSVFAQLQLLFFNVATFTIVCILHIESHFFMCGAFPIFSKKCFKIQPQTEAKKNMENWYQQGPKIVPKSLKINSFSNKLHQNNRFSGYHFLHHFLHWYFRLCRSILGPKWPSWQKVFSSIFTIFGVFSMFFRFFLPPPVFCSFLFIWNATSTQK